MDPSEHAVVAVALEASASKFAHFVLDETFTAFVGVTFLCAVATLALLSASMAGTDVARASDDAAILLMAMTLAVPAAIIVCTNGTLASAIAPVAPNDASSAPNDTSFAANDAPFADTAATFASRNQRISSAIPPFAANRGDANPETA